MMVYGTVSLVKRRLPLIVGDKDTEIGYALERASSIVDMHLREYTTVPLQSPDDEIVSIACDLAAELFRQVEMPTTFTRDRLDMIGERLQVYIRSHFYKSKVTLLDDSYDEPIT